MALFWLSSPHLFSFLSPLLLLISHSFHLPILHLVCISAGVRSQPSEKERGTLDKRLWQTGSAVKDWLFYSFMGLPPLPSAWEGFYRPPEDFGYSLLWFSAWHSCTKLRAQLAQTGMKVDTRTSAANHTGSMCARGVRQTHKQSEWWDVCSTLFSLHAVNLPWQCRGWWVDRGQTEGSVCNLLNILTLPISSTTKKPHSFLSIKLDPMVWPLIY